MSCRWFFNCPAMELLPPTKALLELGPWGKDWFYIKKLRLEIWNPWTVSMDSEWILNFVQEFGVRTDLQRSWFHHVKLFLSFLICEAKTGPTSKLFRLEIGFGNPGLSACAEWNLKFVQELGVRTDLQRRWFHQVKLFLNILICEAKTGSTSKLFMLEIGFGNPGLSACAEWILNFVQEFGVRTDLQRSWFHHVKLFLSFLICEAKTGPTSKLFRLEIGFGNPGLSACTEWNLKFVQEFGVRTDLQRS